MDDGLLFHGVFPFPPSANNLWMVAKGSRRIIPSAEAARFKQECSAVVLEWMQQQDLPLSGEEVHVGDVDVVLHVYRPNRRYDLDNSIKASIDVLKKRIIKDDNQVVRIMATARIDKAEPRAEIWVYEAMEG